LCRLDKKGRYVIFSKESEEIKMTIKSYKIKSFLSFLLMITAFSSSGYAEGVPGTEYIDRKSVV
jgi:hypothetical protein